MAIGQEFSNLTKNACAMAVCSGIGEYGAHAMSLGQPGLGAALGGTAYLVNKVVGSVFDKFIQTPDLTESNAAHKFTKLAAYALAYSVSKVVVVAATIAISSAVANSIGLTASVVVINSLSTANNFGMVLESAFYAGALKGCVSSILNSMSTESQSASSCGDGLLWDGLLYSP